MFSLLLETLNIELTREGCQMSMGFQCESHVTIWNRGRSFQICSSPVLNGKAKGVMNSFPLRPRSFERTLLG
ncbi:hypothetical protein Y032_0215g2351 [Ancylostoma ceylanicum]|uniref:Uncharacterized protein n=1 Tax=Ancylostoma ceylanicum TaxID=53326 RepID=A0A016SJZ7_9BILA|nr:hypothetical protein Y032_0215g2351 [Ancylostoma ceylanicum]